MTRIFFITILLAFFSASSFGQWYQKKKPRYLAKIEDKAENFILTGALFGVSDSTVTLTCSSCKAAETERFQIEVSVKKIDKLTIYRNSRLFTWLVAGGTAGMAGFFLAYVNYKENGTGILEPRPVNISTMAAAGALSLVTVGIIRSISVEKPLFINKDIGRFSRNTETIKKYSFSQ